MARTGKSPKRAETERLLPRLFENTFLRYAGFLDPRGEDGRRLCDAMVVHLDHVFVFLEGKSGALQNAAARGPKIPESAWRRWKKEAVERNLRKARAARNYVRSGKPVFLDRRRRERAAVDSPPEAKIHALLAVRGAEKAREKRPGDGAAFGVFYGNQRPGGGEDGFFVHLARKSGAHVLDERDLVIFEEMDSGADLLAFFAEKERAAERHGRFECRGEEELLARHLLGLPFETGDGDISLFVPEEGAWRTFVSQGGRRRTEKMRESARPWNDLLVRARRSFEHGTEFSQVNPSRVGHPLRLMESERLSARAELGEGMREAESRFAEDEAARFDVLDSPGDPRTLYAFLQMRFPSDPWTEDGYRGTRERVLEMLCGALKIARPDADRVIGVVREAPGSANRVPDDFILLDCAGWNEDDRGDYGTENLLPAWRTFVEKCLSGGGRFAEIPPRGEPPWREAAMFPFTREDATAFLRDMEEEGDRLLGSEPPAPVEDCRLWADRVLRCLDGIFGRNPGRSSPLAGSREDIVDFFVEAGRGYGTYKGPCERDGLDKMREEVMGKTIRVRREAAMTEALGLQMECVARALGLLDPREVPPETRTGDGEEERPAAYRP